MQFMVDGFDVKYLVVIDGMFRRAMEPQIHNGSCQAYVLSLVRLDSATSQIFGSGMQLGFLLLNA